MSPASRRPRRNEADNRPPGVRPMHLSLRAGERLFLNGAVVRVDRKVTLELLNDATFLLENHVLQVEDTTTPLRQLYFAVQAMLMDPQNAEASRRLFDAMATDVRRVLDTPLLSEGVAEAAGQVAAERPFHALRTLRNLFAEEAALLALPPEAADPRGRDDRRSRRAASETDATPCAIEPPRDDEAATENVPGAKRVVDPPRRGRPNHLLN
ncbi:flagellar biosynthesis repressor FlbT [Acuticoccus sp. M5D2P5]|uniref:flagellar biosynthesis repressor FlbT n=1 Tax=Acuticoccus kalidii TaxID=2910977 RepID=UPI001F4353E2|nr:flagellar biosynthesis repressor FlbT [Acuticoccus kalidii]MCF3932488.1 flagellar biosynthesis repressor FlbT [Acuticoccus kalidii]